MFERTEQQWMKNIRFFLQSLPASDLVLAWSVLSAATKSDVGASAPNGRVCQNPFERVPLPRPNWTQLAWKHCTCIRRPQNGLPKSPKWRPGDLLHPLTRDLLRLNVARNSLSEVPSEALLQLKNLNQLDLSFNKIKVIAENTFAGE